MDASQPHPAELDLFVRVLEGQRNAALTELARLAARATVLETEVVALRKELASLRTTAPGAP
jgi:hypothetical protein